MKPHPDFAASLPPRRADIGVCRLEPLAPASVAEDFANVTASARVLRGLFGTDWPLGLTLAENRIDLAWHEREFTLGRSFSWILRGETGAYLGCAYVFPDPGARLSGDVYLWLTDTPDRLTRLAAIRREFAIWLALLLPTGAQYDWHLNDRP